MVENVADPLEAGSYCPPLCIQFGVINAGVRNPPRQVLECEGKGVQGLVHFVGNTCGELADCRELCLLKDHLLLQLPGANLLAYPLLERLV